jgi:hypothetical protein
MAICVDYDDAQAAAIRAGLSLADMAARLAENGATHLSLPEITLDRLRALGLLTPQAPPQPRTMPPRVGHWNYLHGPAELLAYLAAELNHRLPYTEAAVLENRSLAFAGDLPTIGEIGLGFDPAAARSIQQAGLSVVPRPVSYAWPEKALLERTLAQAAALGPCVAFAGDMILGHEMHLDETLAAMTQARLTFVYFCESRHQKGDWFIAKRRAPHVVLAHRFTPAEMIPLDFHAAAHNWAHFARERGIRFCYVNFFRVLHATAPLEGLSYVHHLKHALEDAGFVVAADVEAPAPIPAPDKQELALTGLAAAGIGAVAVNELLRLPEAIALPLAVAAAGGAAALPYVEQARNQAAIARLPHGPVPDHHHHAHDHEHHHHDEPDHEHHDVHGDDQAHDHHHEHEHGDLQALYPPSYAPKLLALSVAAFAPVASLKAAQNDGLAGWTSSLMYQAAAAAALAATTSGQEYQLRIEEYRGFNLDWALPLAAAALAMPQRAWRAVALAALATAWLAARQRGADPLAAVDPGHAEGHTHHISAAMRLVGDATMAIGPQPARKWTGLGPLASALSLALARHGRQEEAAAAAVAAMIGHMFGLVGFRRAERALQVTAGQALPSFALGAGAGLLLLLGSTGFRGVSHMKREA